MKFGYFDNKKREYVIERPDTPMSWVNYLGTENYCGIISNNASGYGFNKSAKTGRMLRFRFNSIPMDRPGRYIYIRDNEDGDYWSATWQPVAKPFGEYRTACSHGMGYTRFESEYRGIKSNYRVFVPIDKPIEFWEVELENTTQKEKDISIFTYAEWCFWYMDQDLTNFQYILYTCNMSCENDMIDYSIKLVMEDCPKAFMTSSLPVESFDTDRDVFIGNYNSESNPAAVVNGKCFNSVAVGGNPCASVQNRITLKPGEKKYALYIVGIGNAQTFGKECKEKYADRKKVEEEFEKVQEYWNKRLAGYKCSTPSEEINTMVNIWNQYQCHTTYNWSRSASFNEAGGRDGLGYRDTNQDTLGVVHSIPGQVKGKLIDLLKGQMSKGAALHGFQPLEWKQDVSTDVTDDQIFSDDHLWLLISIPSYIKETGDMGFLNSVVPYCDKGEDSVYGHMKKALEFSWSKRGPHGLLLGMRADWNDCINLKGKGESIWSTFLYYKCLEEIIILASRIGRTEDVKHFTGYREEIKKNIDEYAWDGKWFLRGYLDSGKKLGGQESDQSKIFINSQTWSVVSGAVSTEKGLSAMDSLKEFLATEHGIVKNYPAYRKYDPEIGAITSFPPSLKENAGIFCHSNTWAVIAETMLGRGDRAFEFYRSYLPAAKNDNADLYTMEPYVYSQFITGKEHPYHFGRARNSWLTGTASWSFVAASQYILGVRADYDGLIIDPCIPTSWDKFEVIRSYRGATYKINISNPHKVSKGITEITIDGKKIEGNTVPVHNDGKEHIVNVIMG